MFVLNFKSCLFVLDVIGHIVEKDTIREAEKNGKKHRVIDLTLEDLE
jgi:hypothetical protein